MSNTNNTNNEEEIFDPQEMFVLWIWMMVPSWNVRF